MAKIDRSGSLVSQEGKISITFVSWRANKSNENGGNQQKGFHYVIETMCWIIIASIQSTDCVALLHSKMALVYFVIRSMFRNRSPDKINVHLVDDLAEQRYKLLAKQARNAPKYVAKKGPNHDRSRANGGNSVKSGGMISNDMEMTNIVGSRKNGNRHC